MSSELQKDDFILPGDLGTVNGRNISKMFKGKDGATTLTIGPPTDKAEIIDDMKPLKDYLQGKSSTTDFVNECRQISKTEEAEFEVIEPKQIKDKK